MQMTSCRECGAIIPTGSLWCLEHQQTSIKGWKNGSTRKWRTLRLKVLERDGYQCQLRLKGCTGKADTVDHIVPLSKHGTDDPNNLTAACWHCNRKKGDRFDNELVIQPRGYLYIKPREIKLR